MSALAAALICLGSIDATAAEPAKQIFGKVTLPSQGAPSPIGFYAKGCMAGGECVGHIGPRPAVSLAQLARDSGLKLPA